MGVGWVRGGGEDGYAGRPTTPSALCALSRPRTMMFLLSIMVGTSRIVPVSERTSVYLRQAKGHRFHYLRK